MTDRPTNQQTRSYTCSNNSRIYIFIRKEMVHSIIQRRAKCIFFSRLITTIVWRWVEGEGGSWRGGWGRDVVFETAFIAFFVGRSWGIECLWISLIPLFFGGGGLGGPWGPLPYVLFILLLLFLGNVLKFKPILLIFMFQSSGCFEIRDTVISICPDPLLSTIPKYIHTLCIYYVIHLW